MSFGASPSDIITLISLTTKAYRGWSQACGQYSDVTSDLDSFLVLLERIETESKKPNTVLWRSSNEDDNLKDIIANSEPTVRELHAVLAKYKSLGSSRKRNWDRLRFGVKNLDTLRAKLNQHTTAISAYLETIGLESLSRIEKDVHAIPEQIQQSIDALASEIRAGRREGSIMTTYSDDEKEVWKQFRRELIGDGFRSKDVHKYKPLIRRYLQDLAERGELEEMMPCSIESDNSETSTHHEPRLECAEDIPSRLRIKDSDEESIPKKRKNFRYDDDFKHVYESSGSEETTYSPADPGASSRATVVTNQQAGRIHTSDENASVPRPEIITYFPRDIDAVQPDSRMPRQEPIEESEPLDEVGYTISRNSFSPAEPDYCTCDSAKERDALITDPNYQSARSSRNLPWQFVDAEFQLSEMPGLLSGEPGKLIAKRLAQSLITTKLRKLEDRQSTSSLDPVPFDKHEEGTAGSHLLRFKDQWGFRAGYSLDKEDLEVWDGNNMSLDNVFLTFIDKLRGYTEKSRSQAAGGNPPLTSAHTVRRPKMYSNWISE